MSSRDPLRRLPAIDKILSTPRIAELKRCWLARVVDEEVRAVVGERRQRLLAGESLPDADADALAAEAGHRLAQRLAPHAVRCVNATGVVLHTGLGRALLPPAAVEALARETAGYTVVSVDREEGQRLRRETTCARLICALTGAEAATVVNNNAAATLIALNTLAAGREAILSRGQLVEIGGSFRMPEVFLAAGVRLREVGTTNRTHLADYERAIGEETGLLLRVHPSNYQVVGFTSEVGIEELVELGRRRAVPVMDDLGAGALTAFPPEPEIAHSILAGADVICCSGDKLIGGPQAGILLGRREWIDRIRRNPLFRALRVDKLTLVALEATLRLYLRPQGLDDAHPTWRMLHRDPAELAAEAAALADRVRAAASTYAVDLVDDHSQVGSGSLPGERLPTTLVRIVHPRHPASTFARHLRQADPPVFTRIVDDRVCLDPRTLQPGDADRIAAVVTELS